MDQEEKGLLVFDSINQSLKTERLLKSACVPCTVIPTPVESDGRQLLFPFKRNRSGGITLRKEGFA